MAADKWKYATLPAEERLRMIRDGNSDVYKSEMERTKEVIKAREKEGLDTTSQVNWANSVGYSYNLKNAESMGIPEDKVDKIGYGERMTSEWQSKANSSNASAESENDGGKKRSALSSYRRGLSAEKKRIDSAIRKTYERYKSNAKAAFNERLSVLRESLINDGANPNGGKMISEELKAKSYLGEITAKYDTEMENALSENADAFDKKLAEYRKSLLDITNDARYKVAELNKQIAETRLEAEKQADDKARWQAEFDFDRQKEQNDYEKWKSEHALDEKKEENDSAEWQAEFDFDKQKEETDKVQWKGEYDLKKDKEENDRKEWQSEFDFEKQKEQTDYDIWKTEHYSKYGS